MGSFLYASKYLYMLYIYKYIYISIYILVCLVSSYYGEPNAISHLCLGSSNTIPVIAANLMSSISNLEMVYSIVVPYSFMIDPLFSHSKNRF